MTLLIIFLFQCAFNMLKVFEIKYSYESRIKPLLIVTALLSILSLSSIYLSLSLLLDGNILVVPFYVIGSMVGKYSAIKMPKVFK